MKKRLIAAVLVIAFACSIVHVIYAHEKEGRNGHDQYMSWVLFGSKTYKKDNLSEKSKEHAALTALENAVALCVDQYKGNYKEELKALQKMHIHGLPKDISEIDFRGNNHHRRYTHRGWNYIYTDDKSHWSIRKTILLQTVNKVFGFQTFAGEWQFILFRKDFGYNKQCEAFAELLYYIHVLSDIPDSGMDEGYSDMIKLAVAGEPSESNPDIYYELLQLLPNLYLSQTTDRVYSGLVSDIRLQAKSAREFIKNNPDLKSVYDTYQEYADQLLEMLSRTIPSLLKKEPFFEKVFYASEN